SWYESYKNGEFEYFSHLKIKIGDDYDWITNPDSGYKYKLDHWLDIDDYNVANGDIKYVWEPSRFSHLYSIIRYDYHFETDCSKEVFTKIIDWIDKNGINVGPNYKCSQEISLRVLNWVFALNYYKNSKFLTAEVFNKIQHSIYW